MRVVHLVPAMEEGGVERVVLSLTRELVKAGHESVVVSRVGGLVAEIEKAGGRHLALDLKSKNPLSAVPRAISLARLLGRTLPPASDRTVVLAHSRVPAWLFVLARALGGSRLRGLTFFTFAHGANSVSFYSSVMTKGERVLVPSEFMAGYLREHYRFDHSRIRVVSPCVDLERFDPARCPAPPPEHPFTSLAVGRITPLKGFDNLIRDLRPGRRLVIVGGVDRGKEAHLAYLRELAAELGVADRVEFAGARSDVPEWIAKADEVVSGNTVKPETFGLSVAEALAMNRPVRLLRHFGGAAEIVDAVNAEIAAGRAADFRGAVRNLYSPASMIARFLSVCNEVF